MAWSATEPGQSRSATMKSVQEDQHQLVLVEEQRPGHAVDSRRKWRRGRRDVEDASSLDALFGNSRPKNVGLGLLGGVGSVVKGVAYGAGALIAAPVVGYNEGGATGMLKGVGLGVAAAVAFPLAGVVAGTKQTFQGGKTTYESFQSKNAGKEFDERTGHWVDKYRRLDDEFEQAKEDKLSLEAERIRLKQQHEGASKGRKLEIKGDGSVVDTEYYELLGVSATATQSEIRKAYYQLAKECHPDKHGGDPAMKEKFQQIGEAYQVLGDPERREQYNKQGKAAAEKMEFVDSSLLFVMLFGSDAMQPYIGKLGVATTVESELMDEDGNEEERSLEQKELEDAYRDAAQSYREAELAVLLRDRLQPFVAARQADDNEALARWTQNMYDVASKLCQESFGAELLDAVGFGYENYATHYMDKKDAWYGTAVARIHLQKRQFDVLCSAVQSASKVSRATKRDKKKKDRKAKKAQAQGQSTPPDDIPEDDLVAMEKSLEHILKTVLNICLLDIATTIKAACKKTLNDKAIEEPEQRLRAEGLLQLGKMFQEVATDYKARNKPTDAMSQMQDAYVKMAQKMDEQHHEASSAPPSPA